MGRVRYSDDALLEENIIGSNIKALRKERKMTQVDLAEAVQQVMKSPSRLTNLSMSGYEIGLRVPPLPTLLAIAQVFGCSLDYLCGLKEDIEIAENQSLSEVLDECPLTKYDIELRSQELEQYNKEAVYVKFKKGEFTDGWFILDYDHRKLKRFEEEVPLFTYECRIFRVMPIQNESAVSLNYVPLKASQIESKRMVWVEYRSANKDVYNMYTGYYVNSSEKRCLVKKIGGFTLPYNGAGISYNAYATN